MNIDKDIPLYFFDTSALLDFALERTPCHSELLNTLSINAQYFYHPITIAEIATYLHPEIWKSLNNRYRYNEVQIKDEIRKRQYLIAMLYKQRKKDEPITYLYDRRFLPFHIVFNIFSLIAHQRSDKNYLCKTGDGNRCTVVADLTDHQILSIAYYMHSKRKYDVKFISGDKRQLAAAGRFKIPWIYSKNPHVKDDFPWIRC